MEPGGRLSRRCIHLPCLGRAFGGRTACFGHLDQAERADVLQEELERDAARIDVLRRCTVTRDVLEEVLVGASADGVMTRELDARGAVFEKTVGLRGLYFRGAVRLSGIHAKQGCDFTDCVFDGQLSLQGAVVARTVVLRNTTVAGPLDLGGCQLDENLFVKSSRLCSVNAGGMAVTRSVLVAASSVSGLTSFRNCVSGRISVNDTVFEDNVVCNGARIEETLSLHRCTVKGSLSLASISARHLDIRKTTVARAASFDFAEVSRSADVAITAGRQIAAMDAEFARARLRFRTPTSVVLNRSGFSHHAHLEVADARLSAVDARFREGVYVAMTRGVVDLTQAQIEGQAVLVGAARPALLGARNAYLRTCQISNFDLSQARWAGATGVELVSWSDDVTLWRAPSSAVSIAQWLRRLLGKPPLSPEVGYRRGRRTIADEWDWRQSRPRSTGWALPAAMRVADAPSADQVSRIYRDLRRGREAIGDHAGAADLYYGEMEIRRLAARRASIERIVLGTYRLVSGYGLKVARPLLCVVALWFLLAVGFSHGGIGRAQNAGATSAGVTVVTTRSCRVPRWTWAPCLVTTEGAHVAAESIVSLPSGTPVLTSQGRTLRLVARLVGPVVLALLVLAIRNRVRR